MNTSNQTYKQLAIPYFKEVFELIDDVMGRRGIQCYLVGVSAMAKEWARLKGLDVGVAHDILLELKKGLTE